MVIIKTSTGEKSHIEILEVELEYYNALPVSRYFFNWNKEQKREVYNLRIEGTIDILGLISLERIPKEFRIHIRLLAVSSENIGTSKKYIGIAPNLISHAAKIALTEYGHLACVSLKPKNKITQHYINKYHMIRTGTSLSIEMPDILKLINTLDHEG